MRASFTGCCCCCCWFHNNCSLTGWAVVWTDVSRSTRRSKQLSVDSPNSCRCEGTLFEAFIPAVVRSRTTFGFTSVNALDALAELSIASPCFWCSAKSNQIITEICFSSCSQWRKHVRLLVALFACSIWMFRGYRIILVQDESLIIKLDKLSFPWKYSNAQCILMLW